ncbi:MAG: hypothetical protein ACTSUK_04225 [Promethearchaeota archaeon]
MTKVLLKEIVPFQVKLCTPGRINVLEQTRPPLSLADISVDLIVVLTFSSNLMEYGRPNAGYHSSKSI